MDLLSLILTLEPEKTASLPPRLGRAAHAILLDHLAQQDAALAQRLHDMDQAKPITSSSVLGSRRDGMVLARTPYTLRYTALATEVAEPLATAFTVGERLHFESATFTITAIDSDPERSPWAGSDSYEALAARHLVPGHSNPQRRWKLLLASPTAFKSKGKTQPLPLPGLVFGSLVRRWNTFAPVALPWDGVQQYAEEMVAISRFKLRSAPGWDRGAGKRIGSIGNVTYTALNRDRYWLAVMGLLAEFALYSGIGAMTTMGLGQARREDYPTEIH